MREGERKGWATVMTTGNPGRVLALLQLSGQSGLLTFTPTVPPENAAWLATCMLHEGELLCCQVTRRVDGGQLTDSQALAWLQQQPHVFWYLQPRTLADSGVLTASSGLTDAQESEGTSSPGDGHGVPRRTALGESVSVQMIAREERVVFALIDGRRSKADLQRLLPVHLDLNRILERLAQCGYIVL